MRIGEVWFGLATATGGLPKYQSTDALLVIGEIITDPIFAVTLDPVIGDTCEVGHRQN